MTDRDPLLQKREYTHGDFRSNAGVSQFLKRYFRATQNGYADGITIDAQWEALDMICLKLSRILSGQSDFKDHWNDIAGYARLGMESCDESAMIKRRIAYLGLRIGSASHWGAALTAMAEEREGLLHRLKVMDG
jgi:hypothetical protein